jgi:signal transduction histidine kinase/CheY-like chemotaxis protein
MRITSVVSIVVALILLLSWLSLRAINPEAEQFDRALGEINRFSMIDNALYRDVFTARAGMLRNYDPLVHEIDDLYDSLDRLRKTASFDAMTTAAVDQLAASVVQQEALVERFKSDNALLHNSLAYFRRFSVGLASSDLGPAVGSVAAAMLNLTLDTSSSAAREVQDRLDELARHARTSDEDEVVAALLTHGRMLHDLLPAVDKTLKTMRAVPRRQNQDALRAMVVTLQSASRMTARLYRGLLYGTSLVLVGFLVQLARQLRMRANALQRRAAFEHVIAGISMRFINAPPQNIDAEIERALADMAGCIGSDRAYFVTSGPAPRRDIWCRDGMSFSPGWPERAHELAGQLSPVADGIVHIRSVDRLPPGEIKSICVALGIGGMACVTNVGADGVVSALGFEAIGRRCRVTATDELSLLRMGLDTIVYAVGRHSMEKERARLETRLQQAHRLETVGTFTSGIAHNFNNILGGILGHSELIGERVGPDSQLHRSLGAIRAGAERARDLVEQILAFGRRRDAHRQFVSVRTLIAEAELLLNGSLPPEIDLSIAEPQPAAVISGEPAQLQQVILNLCNNAALAMKNAGRIELAADVQELVGPRSLTDGELGTGRYVRITVKDSGCGMDEATRMRIFEPFFTTRPDGNGLGLATVREIVRQHGGAMNVQSAAGEGSRFEVWLPCEATAEPVAEIDASALPLGHGETILIVGSGDARLLRDEEMLAALGYEPVGFSSADAALAACRATPERFDTLVVGCLGSAGRSLELAAALHAAAPRLPIVLASKSIEEIGADRLVAAGVTDVVHWPIVAPQIAAALHHCPARRAELEPRRTAPHAAYS